MRLQDLTIAKPCPASWDAMTGDDRVRRCELCKLNVYNIAALTKPEALGLIERSEGRVCLRLYKRADGTVLTADCPVGVQAAWRRVLLGASSVLAAILFVSTTLSVKRAGRNGGEPTTFAGAEVGAKNFLVKHLPEWMVPPSWRSQLEQVEFLGAFLDPVPVKRGTK
jgi:hypothetical protein